MTRKSVIGYPRIGRQRELKFWTESYFRDEISESTLYENSKKIKKENWIRQKENNIDFIPSNDFSFYDLLLDTAFSLNIIQKKYTDLNLTELDTYLSMARGFQSKDLDVTALGMKKWFNTNYHYIVPVIDKDTSIKIRNNKVVEEYLEALSIGIKTKPTMIGPFTLLKLCEYKDEKIASEFIDSISSAYIDIIKNLKTEGAEWFQLEEPFLVTDLADEDVELFLNIYKNILSKKSGIKIILQTYYGDIRDAYKEIINLDFDGIGLDFVEGKESFNLIQKYGFPKDKTLFSGVLNGKNIWRNHYKNTISLLNKISNHIDKNNIVIGASSSFIHLPYTTDNESLLSEDQKKLFIFADEKLVELNELSEIFDNSSCESEPLCIENEKILNIRKGNIDNDLKTKIDGLTEKNFIRKPGFYERELLQKEKLNLPILPTTTIGSFPQTSEVRKLRLDYRKNSISKESYETQIKEKIKDLIKLQEDIGLDVLVHGEFERTDMVEYFAQNLLGYFFTENGWVQSYGTRCLKPPVIWEDIKRKEPFTVKWTSYAQSLTDKPVKGMLTGPVTILNWSFPREDISREEMAIQIALAMKDEVEDLEKAGIGIIQIDEAALKEKLPIRKVDWKEDYLNWAIKSFRLLHSDLKPETQIHTHMCYSEFDSIIEDIDAMDADVITFEASRSSLAILDTLKENKFRTQVGPGVYDVHSPRVPSIDEIKAIIEIIINKIDYHKVWVNPDCGLKTRGEKETEEALRNLVIATKKVRTEL